MNAKQKAIRQLQKKCIPIQDENKFDYYSTNNIVFAIDIALEEQAKEIFCTIEMMDIDDLSELWTENQYKKIKEKYLPTSHKEGKK